MSFNVPETCRVMHGPLESSISDGNNGLFLLKSARFKRVLTCIASDGDGWEHVSVSHVDRCPTWEEMCYVKSRFWGDDDFVVQMHVPSGSHINNHKYCLHLWRKAGTNDFCARPEGYMV